MTYIKSQVLRNVFSKGKLKVHLIALLMDQMNYPTKATFRFYMEGNTLSPNSVTYIGC